MGPISLKEESIKLYPPTHEPKCTDKEPESQGKFAKKNQNNVT